MIKTYAAQTGLEMQHCFWLKNKVSNLIVQNLIYCDSVLPLPAHTEMSEETLDYISKENFIFLTGSSCNANERLKKCKNQLFDTLLDQAEIKT